MDKQVFLRTWFLWTGSLQLVDSLGKERHIFVCIWDYDVREVASPAQCYGYLSVCALDWPLLGFGGGSGERRGVCGWGVSLRGCPTGGVMLDGWFAQTSACVITGWPPFSVAVLLPQLLTLICCGWIKLISYMCMFVVLILCPFVIEAYLCCCMLACDFSPLLQPPLTKWLDITCSHRLHFLLHYLRQIIARNSAQGVQQCLN